jgi:hypothetical protein
LVFIQFYKRHVSQTSSTITLSKAPQESNVGCEPSGYSFEVLKATEMSIVTAILLGTLMRGLEWVAGLQSENICHMPDMMPG